MGEHPFWQGGGLVWCKPDDPPIFQSIHSTVVLFFKSTLWKIASARIEAILPPAKQQRRALPSLLSVSFFYDIRAGCGYFCRSSPGPHLGRQTTIHLPCHQAKTSISCRVGVVEKYSSCHLLRELEV